jgi:biopolymer transport protein ExbD
MKKRPRGRDKTDPGLMLAALIDMLVNILIFLLTLYGSDPGQATEAGVELAASTSEAPVARAVIMVISQEFVSVEGRTVAPLEQVAHDQEELRTVLQHEWDQVLAEADVAADDEKPAPELVLEIDRRVPWTSLRPVLKTAAAVGFVDLRFVVSTVSEHPALAPN